jgi:hypothetical protein
MPNWVFNSLVVSGEKSELDRMVAHLNTPFEKHFPKTEFNKEEQKWVETPDVQVYDNPVFAFWNICRPSDLEKYYGEEVHKNREGMFDKDGKMNNDAFMAEFVRSMSEDEDWYHWNVRNWGTKWDVAVSNGDKYPNTTMEVNDDGSIMYHFQTAWSPVGEALTKLSEMFPTLTFNYEYEEEQGWGGVVEFLDGEESIINEWDIPESHADYKALDRECYCEFEDDPEYWYKDCPVDTTKYKWNAEDNEWEENSIDIPAEVR